MENIKGLVHKLGKLEGSFEQFQFVLIKTFKNLFLNNIIFLLNIQSHSKQKPRNYLFLSLSLSLCFSRTWPAFLARRSTGITASCSCGKSPPHEPSSSLPPQLKPVGGGAQYVLVCTPISRHPLPLSHPLTS